MAKSPELTDAYERITSAFELVSLPCEVKDDHIKLYVDGRAYKVQVTKYDAD